MVDCKEKFIVINKKHLNELNNHPDTSEYINEFYKALDKLEPLLPKNNYYIVNQDEPYASLIWSIISHGEDAKQFR